MTLPGREDGDGVPGQGNIFNHLGIKILTLVIPNCALLDERGRDMGWGPVRFDYWGILGDGCYLIPKRWRNRDTWRWQMGGGGFSGMEPAGWRTQGRKRTNPRLCNYLIQPLDVIKNKTHWKLLGTKARESDSEEFLDSELRKSSNAKECYTQITLCKWALIFITATQEMPLLWCPGV